MIKQPQDKTEFHQSDCLEDDNITLYDHQADTALSDNQLSAALKEGKSIFQIKDLLKPPCSGKPAVSPVAQPPTTSSSTKSGVEKMQQRNSRQRQLRLSGENLSVLTMQHANDQAPSALYPLGMRHQKKFDIIHIEMKQTHFYVHRDLLTETHNTQFATKFGNAAQSHFILDRDPKMFNQVLEYLRLNRDYSPKSGNKEELSQFQDELKYWGLNQQNFSTEHSFQAEDSNDKFIHQFQSDQSIQTHSNPMDEHQNIWARQANRQSSWSHNFDYHLPFSQTSFESMNPFGKSMSIPPPSFNMLPPSQTGMPGLDQNLSGLQWQYAIQQEKLYQNQQLQSEFEKRIQDSNTIAGEMIEPEMINYVDHNNIQNIRFLSQLKDEAFGTMQTINSLKYQIDQAQIDVHRQQQQISESLPAPENLFSNLSINPPKFQHQDGPKIEVEDLSKDKPISEEDNEGQVKKSTRPQSTCPTEEKIKESTKEGDMEEQDTQDEKSATNDEKITPSGAKITPVGVQPQKKGNLKKISRSSKNLKKVKKRQPPQIRCGHPDKPHYSDGLCQKCYQKRFYQRKKLKANGGTMPDDATAEEKEIIF